jgi:tetratricopeptide (TPR) repeat protein
MRNTFLFLSVLTTTIFLSSCEENKINENNYDSIELTTFEPTKPDTFFIQYFNHYIIKNDTTKVGEIWSYLQNNNIEISENYVAYGNFINQNKMRNDDAIALYKEAIRLKPSYYLPYKIIGNLYIHYNMLQDALNYLTQANQLEPKDIEVINNIANIYLVDKQYDIAINYYTKAIEIAPNEVVYSNRAICYENIGEYELAQQDYAMAEGFKK